MSRMSTEEARNFISDITRCWQGCAQRAMDEHIDRQLFEEIQQAIGTDCHEYLAWLTGTAVVFAPLLIVEAPVVIGVGALAGTVVSTSNGVSMMSHQRNATRIRQLSDFVALARRSVNNAKAEVERRLLLQAEAIRQAPVMSTANEPAGPAWDPTIADFQRTVLPQIFKPQEIEWVGGTWRVKENEVIDYYRKDLAPRIQQFLERRRRRPVRPVEAQDGVNISIDAPCSFRRANFSFPPRGYDPATCNPDGSPIRSDADRRRAFGRPFANQ
jgi:hypothetical protein